MRIRRWLLGDYAQRIEGLEAELQGLKAEVENLKVRLAKAEEVSEKVRGLEEHLRILDHLLESEKDNRIWLRSLMKEIEEIRLELEAVKLGSVPEQSESLSLSEEEERQLVLALIRKGAHSPTELKKLVPFGVGKLYRILDKLEREGLIRKVGEKRKTKYVPVETEA